VKSPSLVYVAFDEGRLCRVRDAPFNNDDNLDALVMRRRTETALAVIAICASLGFAMWPYARDAGVILAAQDDPAALADAQLTMQLRDDQLLLQRNIETALAENDSDLAESLLAIAVDKNITIPDELTTRVAAAVAEDNSAGQIAKRFATGLVTGEADDVASLSGTVAGDLFVFGDIRDALREGKRMAMGEEVDHVVLGLAAAGIAITAATYISVGGAAPVRAGLTLVKDARKAGRLGEGLALWAGRSARSVIDAPVLQNAVSSASFARPGASIAGIKAAFKTEKAGGLMKLAKDVGRVGETAGTKGALDTLRISQGPKDVARAARLAESKGSQTRGFFKILGRGALLLAAGAFNLAWWVFGAVMMLIGFLSAIKSTTERTTQSWLYRGKAKRARARAMAQSAQLQPLAVVIAPV
jgi:hypothetical protein